MNERIVYEALVYHVLPWLQTVHVMLPHMESHLQTGNFRCFSMKRLIIQNSTQFKYHLPGVLRGRLH